MFDCMNEYETYIAPLLDKLSNICMMYGLPYFCSVCVKEDGKNTLYKNSMNGSVSQGIVLSDDQILKHINVANGFDTILKRNSIDFDAFDDIDDDL